MATTFDSTGTKKPKAKAKPKVNPLAKRLANPGERSKLADKYLSKAQLAQRVMNKRLDADAAPGLTNREVARQANADTQLKYGAAEKQVGDRLRENQDFTVRDQGFYKDYVDAINAAKTQALANSQQAVGAVTNVGQQLDDSSAKSWGSQAQQMQADAASRGATVDPRLALLAQNASTVRSGLTGSTGAMLAAQGANEQTSFGNRALVAQQQGLEQLQTRGRQRTDIQRDQTDLATEKGQYNTQQRRQIVSDYQDNYLKQASANALNKDKAADNKRADNAAKLAAKKAKSTAHHWAATPNKYDVNQGAWQAWSRQGAKGRAKQQAAIKSYEAKKAAAKKAKDNTTGKDASGNTRIQRQARTSDFRKIYAAARQIHTQKPYRSKETHKVVDPSKLGWRDVFNAIAADYGSADADVLTGAIQMAVLGRTGPSTASALKGLGVDPSRYRQGR